MRQAKQKQQHKNKLLKQILSSKTKDAKKKATQAYHKYCAELSLEK